jgi:D-tyrosyl-tRNA(Tyr) deacylase
LKIVIQRAKKASVVVAEKTVGAIETGMVLLVCFEVGDQQENCLKALQKLGQLRIFDNPQTGRMDLNIAAAQGQFLCISQFTLSWNGKNGHRPSFDQSMPPEQAKIFYESFCQQLAAIAPVEKGIFGAEMIVNIVNDGPVTFSFEF